MVNGGTRFEVACGYCLLRFVVDCIRDAEARAMGDHLRERHPELGLSATDGLGKILDNYSVTLTRR